MEIVTFVVIPEGHGFLSHIREHINSFDNYKQKWIKLAMTNASQQVAKGAYHLQSLALRFSKYWPAQRRLPVQVVIGNTSELIYIIELGEQWERSVSHSLAALLKLDVQLCRIAILFLFFEHHFQYSKYVNI